MDVLFQGDGWVAIDKPAGWVVHRTRGAQKEKVILQALRDQMNRMVFPIHRLDGGACGVLLFAYSSEVAARLQKSMASETCKKLYRILTRGWIHEVLCVEKPLSKDLKGVTKPARTQFHPLSHFESNQPVGAYATARYTMGEAAIYHGRRHQIRRHMAHMRHPVIGDSRYGDLRHNHFMKNHTGWEFLWLQAHRLELEGITIESKLGPPWEALGEADKVLSQ